MQVTNVEYVYADSGFDPITLREHYPAYVWVTFASGTVVEVEVGEECRVWSSDGKRIHFGVEAPAIRAAHEFLQNQRKGDTT